MLDGWCRKKRAPKLQNMCRPVQELVNAAKAIQRCLDSLPPHLTATKAEASTQTEAEAEADLRLSGGEYKEEEEDKEEEEATQLEESTQDATQPPEDASQPDAKRQRHASDSAAESPQAGDCEHAASVSGSSSPILSVPPLPLPSP